MLVDRLEQAGWVRRGPHPSDRRYILIELTGSAIARAPAGLTTHHTQIRQIVARVPDQHRESIRNFLLAAADAAATAANDLST